MVSAPSYNMRRQSVIGENTSPIRVILYYSVALLRHSLENGDVIDYALD